MTPPTPVDGRPENGLGIDLLRPSSSGGLMSSHRRALRNVSGGDNRPATSASNLDSGDRRRTTGSGLRDRISAFTHRMSSQRENSSGATGEEEADAGDDEAREGTKLRGKRLSWAAGRTKTG